MRPARDTVTPVGMGPENVATVSICPAGLSAGRLPSGAVNAVSAAAASAITLRPSNRAMSGLLEISHTRARAQARPSRRAGLLAHHASRLQHHLDALVLLVPEHAVRGR